MGLIPVFLGGWVCAAFFFSAKGLFIYLWTTPDLNIPAFQRAAAERCIALKNSDREMQVNLGMGKVISGFVFIFSEIKLMESVGLPSLEVSFSGLLCLLFSAFLFSLFGVILPGALVQMFPEKLIWPFFYLYQGVRFALAPVTFLLNGAKYLSHRLLGFEEKFSFLTPEERTKLQEGHGQELDETEQKMIHSIFELGETEVKEIMVPRLDTVAVDEEETLQNVVKLFADHQYSRLPVYKKTIDSVTGIINAKDMLKFVDAGSMAFKGEWDLRKILRPAYFVPDNRKVNDLFQSMKKEKVHLAVVVDEYGGTAGIVTLEDILEEIVGEIHDEYDKEEELYKKIDENTFVFDPKINMDDLNQLLDAQFPYRQADFETLGGFIFSLAGSIPREGQSLTTGNFRFTVLKMDGQRIERVRLERLGLPSSGH